MWTHVKLLDVALTTCCQLFIWCFTGIGSGHGQQWKALQWHCQVDCGLKKKLCDWPDSKAFAQNWKPMLQNYLLCLMSVCSEQRGFIKHQNLFSGLLVLTHQPNDPFWACTNWCLFVIYCKQAAHKKLVQLDLGMHADLELTTLTVDTIVWIWKQLHLLYSFEVAKNQ